MEPRGISSAGRAPALQAGGRRFDPVILHHLCPVSPLRLCILDVVDVAAGGVLSTGWVFCVQPAVMTHLVSSGCLIFKNSEEVKGMDVSFWKGCHIGL